MAGSDFERLRKGLRCGGGRRRDGRALAELPAAAVPRSVPADGAALGRGLAAALLSAAGTSRAWQGGALRQKHGVKPRATSLPVRLGLYQPLAGTA